MISPHLIDGVVATVSAVAIQGLMTGTAFDKIVENAPLTGILLAGLWFLFTAYRALTERMITVVSNNTEAMTKVADRMTALEGRVTRIEDK